LSHAPESWLGSRQGWRSPALTNWSRVVIHRPLRLSLCSQLRASGNYHRVYPARHCIHVSLRNVTAFRVIPKNERGLYMECSRRTVEWRE
jgi:hypothetical protein